MAQQPSKVLDVEGAQQDVMLIKVPHFVADSWLAAMDAAEDGSEVELGRVSLAQVQRQHTPTPSFDPTERHSDAPGPAAVQPPAAQAPEYTLQLAGPAAEQHMPHTFRLREQLGNSDAIFALEEQPKHVGVVGQVRKRYDAEVAAQQAGPNGQLDAAYRALSRARDEAASKKTRTMQVIDDPSSSLRRMAPLSTSAMRAARDPQVLDRGHEHRARMDKQPLEAKLFRMFEKQERWKFADLQKQTDQPTVWLKEVLQGIGVLSRKGPNIGLWELQREYKGASR